MLLLLIYIIGNMYRKANCKCTMSQLLSFLLSSSLFFSFLLFICLYLSFLLFMCLYLSFLLFVCLYVSLFCLFSSHMCQVPIWAYAIDGTCVHFNTDACGVKKECGLYDNTKIAQVHYTNQLAFWIIFTLNFLKSFIFKIFHF